MRIRNILPNTSLMLAGITLLSHFEHILMPEDFFTATTSSIEYKNMKPGSTFSVIAVNSLVLTHTIIVVDSTKVKLEVVIPNGIASLCTDGTGGKTCVVELQE